MKGLITSVLVSTLFDLINNSTNPEYARELVFGDASVPILPKEGKKMISISSVKGGKELEVSVKFIEYNPWEKRRPITYVRQDYKSVTIEELSDEGIKFGERVEYKLLDTFDGGNYECSLQEWMTYCNK